SYGSYLGAWLMRNHSDDVSRAFLLYAPSDVADLIAQSRDPNGAYQSFPVLDILANLFNVTADVLRALDLSNPPDYVLQNSFHQWAAENQGTAPPVYLLHGTSDTVVPSNQSVLFCNAYGGHAINSGGGAQRRASYACGASSRLDLIEQGQHGLDG